MRSCISAIEVARTADLRVEFVAIADRPSSQTLDYLGAHSESLDIVERVDLGDPGLARNVGIRMSSGKYVALVDGDNLISERWLIQAVTHLQSCSETSVVHPEFLLIFGAESRLIRQVSDEDPEFNFLKLLEHNPWDLACAAERTIFQEYPFHAAPPGSGFGYEDWHWNCETLAGGIRHRTVPETVYFVRRKETGSVLAEHRAAGAVIPPTRLFSPEILAGSLNAHSATVTGDEMPTRKVRMKRSISRRLLIRGGRAVWPIVRRALSDTDAAEDLRAKLNEAAGEISSLWLEARRGPVQLPDSVIEELRRIHFVEPRLFPSTERLRDFKRHKPHDSGLGQLYAAMVAPWHQPVSHVFLVPWLVTGGADLEVLNYVRSVVSKKGAAGVMVVATENAESPWRKRLPAGVRFVDFGKSTRGYKEEGRLILLSNLLRHSKVERIHVINSDLGYKVFGRHGAALRQNSRLYATAFCADLTPEGERRGYPFHSLPDCFDHLTAVSADSGQLIRELREIFAFEPDRLFVHYHPAPKTRQRALPVTDGKDLKVLWAGRLDRQKRPDILAEIADAAKHLPITFVAFGQKVLDKNDYVDRLKRLPNVDFKGPFDGFESLPIEEFHVFLYTSQWDGLPNILLEAMAAGLPVIAPNVGGIGELVEDEVSGFLIRDFGDIEAYVSTLRKVIQDRQSLTSVAEGALDKLNNQHTEASFLESLDKFPGYLD
jgi:glycosyltransferase involved in cell wall biosynthesis